MPNEELATTPYPTRPQQEIKSTGIAIVLSAAFTGLGQLYAGHIARGITMMVATPFVALTVFFVAGGVMLAGAASAQSPEAGLAGLGLAGVSSIGAWVAWWVWGMVDARRLCERANTAA